MNKKHITLFVLFTLLCSAAIPVLAYAENNPPDGGFSNPPDGGFSSPGTLNSPIRAESIQELARDILNIVVKVGAPIVVFFLIYVGFLFVTARGNVTTLETAKKALLWTFIGGLILLGAQGLSSVICGTIDTISNQTTCS